MCNIIGGERVRVLITVVIDYFHSRCTAPNAATFALTGASAIKTVMLVIRPQRAESAAATSASGGGATGSGAEQDDEDNDDAAPAVGVDRKKAKREPAATKVSSEPRSKR